MTHSTAGLLLAAGLARRFGANKLAADFRGRPILQHVLDLAAEAGLAPIVVVLGPQNTAPYAPLELHGAHVVSNPHPELGLSGSLRLGLAALADSVASRAIVLLGDQPLLSPAQLEPVLASASSRTRPIVVPRYSGRPGNPVLLERAAWRLADTLTGDRGMSQVIASRPALVRFVDVPGTNPDVDTPADLAALLSGGG